VEQPAANNNLPALKTDLPVLLLNNIDYGNWPQCEIDLCLELGDRMSDEMRDAGHPVIHRRVEDKKLARLLSEFNPAELIVFNWCEEIPGIPRSAWMVAQELERQGFTYTGADYPALVFSQDKRQVQQRLKDAGVPTPIWRIFYSPDEVAWDLFPAIVKPAFEHYSLGIARESVVQTLDELIRRVGFVLEQHKQPALVEEFIDGRELHVGVIGNHYLLVLPPFEVDFSVFTDIHDRLCTFDTNFNPASISYQTVSTELAVGFTPEELVRMEQAVLGAYRATGCRDYARMDLRLRDGTFYVLDVNHNADISPETSLIRGANMLGYSYGLFGSLLVTLASDRHPVFGNGACRAPTIRYRHLQAVQPE
jgi:D-alanine-D-alanine ligase